MTSQELRWKRRIVPLILGFVCSFYFLLFGTTGGSGLRMWLIPAAVVLLLAILVLAKRHLPMLAGWCEVGITFLLAVIIGAVLISGVVAGLVWASFDTEYATGYTDRAFCTIRLGDSREAVLSRLGEPLASYDTEPFNQWIFSDDQQPSFAESGIGNGTYTTITFDASGRVKNVFGQKQQSANTFCIGDGENFLTLKSESIKHLHGATTDEIRTRFGQPVAVYDYRASRVLDYSRSPSSSSYHLRKLGTDRDGKVVHIWKSIYWD